LSPVEGVDDVVLITDMPGVFADRTAELNTTNKKCENENNPKGA